MKEALTKADTYMANRTSGQYIYARAHVQSCLSSINKSDFLMAYHWLDKAMSEAERISDTDLFEMLDRLEPAIDKMEAF